MEKEPDLKKERVSGNLTGLEGVMMDRFESQARPNLQNPELQSAIPYPASVDGLHRFVGQPFSFTPLQGHGVSHGHKDPVIGLIDRYENGVLRLTGELLYADGRPILCVSGRKGIWLLKLAGSDLGNGGDGDERTVYGRMHFRDLE